MSDSFPVAIGEEINIGDTVYIGRDGALHKSVAQPGHNSSGAPADMADVIARLPSIDGLADLLTAENKEALERVDALMNKGIDFLLIENDQQDSDATEFLVKLRARYKQSEADRVSRKSHFDDLAGSIQAFFKTKILDPLGAAPTNTNEEFDPILAKRYGMGVRITMAQTLYKRAKAEAERKALEAEAARLRKIEDDAKAKREAEAREAKRIADEKAAEEKRKADAEAAERKRIADQAAAEAKALADAAARKRNAETKAAADAAAAEAKRIADKAAAEQAEADRIAKAQQEERDRIAAQEQAERDAAALEEENKLAEARAAAEDAAAATTADLSRARGGKGGVSSLKEFVDVRDVNREDLDYGIIGPYFTDKAVASALGDYAKSNKATVAKGIKTGQQPVRGCVFFMNSKSAGRA